MKQNSGRRLGFAVIGLGNFGLKRIQAISHSHRARVVSVFDPNGSKANKIASEIGAQAQSFPEIIENPDVEVINVTTPNDCHAEYSVQALRAAKVVWCEKPLARTVEECQSVLDVVRDHPRGLKVGGNARFFPNIMKLKELGVESCVGTPLFLRGYVGNSGRQLQSSTWYTKRELVGGGSLLDNGVHLIDLIRWLLGEIESCHATTSNNMWHLKDLEDLAVCTFQLSSGARAVVQASWHEWCGYMYFEICGTQGFVRSDNRFSRAQLTIGNREKVLDEYDYSNLGPISYTKELEQFIDSYHESKEPEPSAYDGYRAVKIVTNCYESARTEKTVSCVE